MLVSNCRSSCGNEIAGDQSGNEWRLQNYFTYGWDAVLRHPDENIRKRISNYARHGALNDHCGYSMNTRTLFWSALQNAKDYDPANIIVDCNADCSSSTASIIKAVGFATGNSKLKNVNPFLTTFNMEEALDNAGFATLSGSIPESSLKAGDIILNSSSHVCIAVADSDFDLGNTNCADNGNKQNSSDTTNTPSSNFYLTGSSRAVAGIQGILVYCGFDVGRYRDKRGVNSGIDGDAGRESSTTNNALKLAIASGKITEKEVKSILEVLGDK